MTDFGWTRLAYLLAILSVLAALAQLGSPSAEPRPLASEPPDGRPADPPATDERHAHTSVAPRTSATPRARPAAPAFAGHLKRAAAEGASLAPDVGRAVFYRPTPRPAPESGGKPRPGPFCGDLGRFPSGNRLVFPLPMQHANSYEDTWGAPRPQGGHEGTDLMVPTGTPEYAVTDGTVVPVAGSNGNGWNSLGGYAVMLRAAYSVGPVREGDLFYYAHLDRESALPLGATVRAGQLVGYAGDTGQGPEVTRGLFPPHLHFGWYDATDTRSYLPSGAMNPYPLLEWLGASGILGGGTDARYCEVPRSGAPIPSTGGDRWPAARDAGARPDLDTGTRRPAPSPAAGKVRSHVRPAERAENPAPGAAAGQREAPAAKAAPGQKPRASKPPVSGTAAGEPGEPPARDANSGSEPRRPAAGQGSKDGSGVPASNEPPKEEGPGLPDGERGSEGAGRGEHEDPSGSAEGQGTGQEEPGEEQPGGDPAPPDEETPQGEDETASEPEAGGSEEPEGETPEETTLEATTLEATMLEATTPEATTPE